ncbi:MAG: hydrogenase formation protein HypD [Bacteroidales bacterium]|nr:hydrogenase formation protein HypD [Bacteroidales bacterium]MCF8336344.1 hydrogenase formation protein HypD [Bacteroidales bacterium]
MKYINEYRQKHLVETLLTNIKAEATGDYHFMEVCGSHTHAIRRFGLPSLLPENIRLLSGPGCPVCVTDQNYINRAVELALNNDTIIATYGDLLHVPGNDKSLNDCREEDADVRVVYSSLDALAIASQNPEKSVVFLAIGFETTAPATAIAIQKADSQNINNLFFLSAHKIMPPAMKAVIDDGVTLNGYICPGHVSTITGKSIYEDFPEKYKVATVISGFEPTDILQSILMLIRQVNSGDFKTEIQYKRAVKPEGNVRAQQVMDEVFEIKVDRWRGFGTIPASGLKLNNRYSEYDADKKFSIPIPEPEEDNGCICGEILKGRKEPEECRLFATVCTPRNPKGACMVSAEGSCNAHFKYRNYG